jgi:CHASE3 domain sensor protein
VTYQGDDERVGDAIRRLGTVARSRMTQMQESIALYGEQGPSAGLRLANSPAGHETMATFRHLAGITRDYERALMNRSLDRWDRELTLAGRLNLATLLLGLLLTVIAATALARNVRQRAEAAAELERQHDALKAQFDAQASGV